MISFRTIIVDDESHAVDSLSILLTTFKEIEIVKTFSNPIRAMDFVVTKYPDLIFLDIKMPGISGIEFAQKLIDMELFIPCIFVTAHHEFSIEALRQHAIDYLLKPVSPAQLKEAVSRVKRFDQVVFQNNLKSLTESQKTNILKFNTRNGFITFPENEILFVKADGVYSNIQLINGKNIMVSQNLGKIASRLNPYIFIKIHRSTIVNAKHIFEVSRLKKECILTIKEKTYSLPASSEGLKQLEKYYREY